MFIIIVVWQTLSLKFTVDYQSVNHCPFALKKNVSVASVMFFKRKAQFATLEQFLMRDAE